MEASITVDATKIQSFNSQSQLAQQPIRKWGNLVKEENTCLLIAMDTPSLIGKLMHLETSCGIAVSKIKLPAPRVSNKPEIHSSRVVSFIATNPHQALQQL